MTQPTQKPHRFKVFRTAGINDFLRTRLGEVVFFDDIPSAQAAMVEAGGGMVLHEDSPAPAGFDAPTF